MARGVAKRPRDCPSVFCQALGIAVDEPNGEWAQIKQAVHDILLRRGLVGKLPSSIRDHATKTAMAEQLEAIHLATFSTLKPSSDRRDLVHRIFAYQMMKLRGDARRKGGTNPQRMPLQPATPRKQATPKQSTLVKPPATPSTQATPELPTPITSPETPSEQANPKPSTPGRSPTTESPVGSLLVESPMSEPPMVESPVVESPVVESHTAESPVAESHPAESPAAESHPVESPVGESHQIETLDLMEVGAAAPEPPATGPPAPGFLGMGPLSIQTLRGAPGRVLAPIPVVNWHKEVVVTTLVPSAPGFLAKFTKSHLLEGSKLSMAKFFEILGEEGFRGEPGDYIVRDEFNDRLVSQRHLGVAFQLLANEEKLETTWRVLKKVEDERWLPGPVFNNPLAPVTTPNVSGSSETGFPGDGSFLRPGITEPAYASDAPTLPGPPPKEGRGTQDHVDGAVEPQLPKLRKVKKKTFLDISDSEFSDSNDKSSGYEFTGESSTIVVR